MSGDRLVPEYRPQAAPRPSRRDLLARVGVLARQSSPARHGPPALDLFAEAGAEAADGMADLVPAGELRDLDLTERVEAELEILGFELSQHVLHFYADLLAGLDVVRSTELADRENGEMILVAGAKVATQTPAVRSGQRIIFASLDDAAGLVDLAFFESVQDRCAARVFASWLLLVRGRVRRAGAGPMAVTVNATECWDLAALDEIRASDGMAAVRAAMAAGDAGPGAQLARLARAGASAGPADADSAAADSAAAGSAGDTADLGESTRPVVFANGFTLSPYAETGGPGGSIKHPPRTLWHASPGSASLLDGLDPQFFVRPGGADKMAVFAIGPAWPDTRGYGGSSPRGETALTSWCGSRRTRSDAAERRLLRLVQRTGTQSRTGGPRPGQGHDGHPTVRVPDLGAAAVRP